MKIHIQQASKYKSKYDNEYFDFTIDGVTFESVEKSDIRYIIQELDNAIHPL